MAKILLDESLDLEGVYYSQGFEDGVSDGKRAGLIQGRFAGLERGYERYAAIARLHGRAVIWAGRLPDTLSAATACSASTEDTSVDRIDPQVQLEDGPHLSPGETSFDRARLRKHVRILYALTERVSLATDFSEDSEAELDDRFRRAEGKIRIVERVLGEGTPAHRVSLALGNDERGTIGRLEHFRDM